jgi:hypothetical protein
MCEVCHFGRCRIVWGWSRLAEELRAERVRPGNRVRHQLWRYYPQMLKLTNDLAAPWFLRALGHCIDTGQSGRAVSTASPCDSCGWGRPSP